MDNHYLLGIFAVMGVATFVTRVLPFVALTKAHDHPLLGRIGKL
ncbi:MAG: AzlD domain-containing protein, partial [Litorivicinaceae bacterium]